MYRGCPEFFTRTNTSWFFKPVISPDAEEVAFEGEIEEIIDENNYVIDGKTVWITADTIFQVNDDVPIVIGLAAQVKGMQNPNGEVVGIKVELN